jgi:hypothetical protein
LDKKLAGFANLIRTGGLHIERLFCIFARQKKAMTTYQMQVNEATLLGQSMIALLYSAGESVRSIVKRKEKHELTYK